MSIANVKKCVKKLAETATAAFGYSVTADELVRTLKWRRVLAGQPVTRGRLKGSRNEAPLTKRVLRVIADLRAGVQQSQIARKRNVSRQAVSAIKKRWLAQ